MSDEKAELRQRGLTGQAGGRGDVPQTDYGYVEIPL